MTYLELLMLAVTAGTCIVSSVTDCRESVIRNRNLIISAILIAICDVIYYMGWGREYLRFFLVDLGGMVIIAIFFYALDIWAAGDSKFFLIVILGIPAQVLTHLSLGPVPGFGIVILIFAAAFVYLFIDTSVQYARRRKTSVAGHVIQYISWRRILVSYFFMVGCVQLVNYGLIGLGWEYLRQNTIILSAIDFLIVLFLIRVRSELDIKILAVIAAALWCINAFLQEKGFLLNFSVNWKFWILVLVIIIFRLFADQFNYNDIPTSKVEERMILSMKTIMQFRNSRVRGLPHQTTEDLRSRLTAEEADAVRRWGESKYGENTVEIVRKIPFAIFISIGTAIFIALEVLAR